MITAQVAATFRGTLYTSQHFNADGTPARCRVNGKCKLWKTRPNEFKLPVVHGLKNYFYITEENAAAWFTSEAEAIADSKKDEHG